MALPEQLTNLSIISKLAELERAGELIPYTPRVVAVPGVKRKIWLTKNAKSWLYPLGKGHPEGVTPEARADARAQLDDFVFGRPMEEDYDLKRLRPREKDVWEVRSHFNPQQLRLFSFFPQPNHLIVVHGKRRDMLEKKEGPKWDKAILRVVDIRRELMGTTHLFGGFSYADYVY